MVCINRVLVETHGRPIKILRSTLTYPSSGNVSRELLDFRGCFQISE